MDALTAETFLTILDEGSFSRAASVLNVTQSTVSTRMRVLEDQLGRRLLKRSKAGVSPTRAGQQFRGHAEAMVQAWRRGRQEVLLPDRFEGVIAVGGLFTLWDRLLIQWLPWAGREMPGVAVRAEVGTSETLMHGVREGLLDMAVVYTPRARPGIAVERLMEDSLVLAGTREGASVADADYVHVDWGLEVADAFSEAYPDAEMAGLSVNHGPLGLQHVLAHGGVGYFPLRTVRPHVEGGRLIVNAEAVVFSRPVYVIYKAGRGDKPFKRALEGLRDIAKDEGGE